MNVSVVNRKGSVARPNGSFIVTLMDIQNGMGKVVK